MGRIDQGILRLFIISILFTVVNGCQRKPELKVNETIVCDLELVSPDGKYFLSNSHPDKTFTGALKSSDIEARSGKHSILLMKGRAFGLECRLKNTDADEYYSLSMWRKGKKDQGFVCVGDAGGKIFYKATEQHDSVGSDGWKRVTLIFHVPPNLNNATLKLYAWNPGEDSVYFDDISISRLPAQTYPQYENISRLNIFVDTLNVLKLAEKRKQAFDQFILSTEDDDWVDGMINHDDDLYRAELRLKGDWLDHLLGAKWSFRIEIKNSQTFMGMRTFSIQNPASRDFLNEWLLHEFCRDQDILATRYGFIPVSFNNKSLGIYAWEEHFEKYLIESNSRREGPILKVNENALWENTRLRQKFKEDISLPVVLAAEIMPFKIKKTANDSSLYKQYLIAQDLFFQYKYGLRPASDIFDIDKLARYVAMVDLFRTYHGITWHNQRFYYNPVLSKLEPIAFDNFSESGPVQYYTKSILGNQFLDLKGVMDETLLLYKMFRDTSFSMMYIKYLEKFSDAAFLQEYMQGKNREINYYDSLIKCEYSKYAFDEQYILRNASLIREELPEFKKKVRNSVNLPDLAFWEEYPVYGQTARNDVSKEFVQAYRESATDTSSSIKVENYFSSNVLILGTSKNGKGIRDFFLPEIEVSSIEGRSCGSAVMSGSGAAEYIHYMIPGDMTTYVIPVYPWPAPGGDTPLQHMLSEYGKNFDNIFSKGEGRQLIMDEGVYEISTPVIIPEGYIVTIKAGAEINLINKAAFISYSTVNILGTLDKPVIIKSSDGTANGFSVFQAGERSKVSHAVFDRLNTLDMQGWTLTGAITFYESDVDFFKTTFQNNLSEDGLNIIRSEFTIDHCEVLNTFADALDVDFGKGSITNTTFSYLSNDAIDVSGSDIDIEKCLIRESNDKGISGGENSVVRVKDTRISGTVIGIASKDFSKLTVSGCSIEDCRYGLVVFKKKPEFGPASLDATGLEMKNIVTPYLIEEGSSCEVNGETIKADSKNVYDIFYL